MTGLAVLLICVSISVASLELDALSRKKKRERRLSDARKRFGLDWEPSASDERLLRERKR